jgi:hypothetical protein
MILKDLREQGVFTKVYEIGQYFGEEPDAVTVKLRGPNTEQIIRMSAASDDEKRGFVLLDMLKELMIDHNVDVEPGKSASVEEVVDIIKDIPDCHSFIVRSLMGEVTDLMQARSESSETSPS